MSDKYVYEYYAPESISVISVNNYRFVCEQDYGKCGNYSIQQFLIPNIHENHVLLIFHWIHSFTASMEHEANLVIELKSFQTMVFAGWRRVQTEERRAKIANEFCQYLLGKINKLRNTGSFGVFTDQSDGSSSGHSGDAIGVPGGSGFLGVGQHLTERDTDSIALLKGALNRMWDLNDADLNKLLVHANKHWLNLKKKFEMTPIEQIQVKVNDWMDNCTAHINIQSTFHPQELGNLPGSALFGAATNPT